MSASRFAIFILILLTSFLSAAQDEEQNPTSEVSYDFRKIPMIYIPSGEFQSGIILEEAINQCLNLRENEGFPPYDPDLICNPDFLAISRNEIKDVRVDAFYMDQYEVSRANYVVCVDADVCSDEPFKHQPLESLNIPLQYATYVDAAAYCAWREARLPTALEWEYAARGPKSFTYAWGNKFDGNIVNHCDVNCSVLGDGASQSIWDDGYSDVAPIDAFDNDQSWVGVYQLAGNVHEWTSTRSALNESLTDSLMVIKGGSYDSYPYQTAGWFVSSIHSLQGRANIGFRCVRTTTP